MVGIFPATASDGTKYLISATGKSVEVKTPEEALARLCERGRGRGAPQRVYAPGCAGEALAFVDAWRRRPALADSVTFVGVWIPGVNRTDYAALHETAASEQIFLSSDSRESFEAGRARFLPLSYTATYARMATAPLDAAVLVVTTPDRDGRVRLAATADFSPAVLARSEVFKIAQINALARAADDAPTYPIETFDIITPAPHPLLVYDPPPPPPVHDEIAGRIASFIDDGSTLQFGLGNVQLATLRALSGKRGLRIHSGMISEPLIDAMDAGVIADTPGAVSTGAALGTERLYNRIAADGRFRFRPVAETHALATLSKIDGLCAVNSVIEVDLFGQANAEFMNGRQISGAGGLVDFLRGASLARHGKPIVALASTAKGGAVSRIVPCLDAPAASVARADIGIVVTEWGACDLRDLDVEARAIALIGIAHPGHRERLLAAWGAVSRSL